MASLAGDLDLRLDEGALEGIDVWYEIRKAYATVKGGPPPEVNAGRTVFSRMELDSVIQGGVLSTEKLVGELPFLKLDGNGAIDLNQMTVDLGLVAAVRNVPELSQDPLGAELKGRSVPLRISGSLDAPKVGVDVEELLKGEATNLLLDKLGLIGGDEDQEGDD
jgi:AsmA protein